MKKNRTYGLMDKIGLLKMIKIMRFTIFILFLSLSQTFAVNSYSQQAKLSLDMRNARVEDVLDRIEKNSEFFFMYNKNLVNVDRKIDIQVEEKNVNEVLNKIFANTDVSYLIKDRQILLINSRMDGTGNESIAQQQKSISGKVTDPSGSPLPGVTVIMKGAATGTITDANGSFNFPNVAGDATLVFSFIGMKTQEVNIAGKSTIHVTMQEETIDIDEVVAVGYLSQKKSLLTGSVETTVMTDNMRTMPSTSVGNLLAGRIAGVDVGTANGLPGNAPGISIRTNSSWNKQDVLYVIDGVVKTVDDFNNLATNEIAEFVTLKDAAAAAVYGARAAGGVILVTTRRGETGKLKIDYSFSYGEDSRQNVTKMTSAIQCGELYNRIRPSSDAGIFTPADFAFFKTLNNGWGYDQLGTIWQNPNVKSHNFSVSGGNEAFKFFAGLSDIKQETFIPGYGYERTNFRFNTTVNISKDLQFFGGLALSNKDQASDRFEGPDAIYSKLMVWQPWQPIYTKGGQYADYGWIANVGAEADKASGYNNTNTVKPDINLSLTYKIPYVKGLSAKVAYATSWTNIHYSEFGKYYQMAVLPKSANGYIVDIDDTKIISWRKNSLWATPSGSPYLYKRSTWSHNKQLNFQLNYSRTFGDHSIQGVLGYEASEGNGSQVYGGREKVPVYLTDQFWGFSSARADTWAGGDADYLNGRKSFIGQATYDYKSKYLLSASFRRDGSMNFAPNKRWGLFPAASAGWVISEEDFFNKDIVNRLKLRGSVGLTGNDAVGGWQWQQSYQQGSTAYFGTTPSPSVGVKYGSIVNPDITWEKTLSYNFGVDMNILNHWDLSLEYYVQDTYDILGSRNASVPTSFSGSLPSENYGEVKAEGIDFKLGYQSSVKTFNYHVNATASYGWNKVIQQDYATNAREIDIPVGKSRNRIVGYELDQLIRTQADLDAFNTTHPGYKYNGISPALGQLVYKDINGPDGKPDGVINDWDKVDIRKNNNSVNFGLNLGGDYKGFSFDMVFAGSLGSLKSFQDIAGGVEWNRLNADWYDKSWTPDNPNAYLPQRIMSGQGNTYNTTSSFWFKKNNYVRLQNINIGYDFKNLLNFKAVDKLKLYVTGSNLFTIDSFGMWDPQGSATGYPIVRTFSVGVNLGF